MGKADAKRRLCMAPLRDECPPVAHFLLDSENGTPCSCVGTKSMGCITSSSSRTGRGKASGRPKGRGGLGSRAPCRAVKAPGGGGRGEGEAGEGSSHGSSSNGTKRARHDNAR